MFAQFFSWWIARLSELVPKAWTVAGARARDGIVIDVADDQTVSVAMRKGGQRSPFNLGAAARQGRRTPVLVRPPADAVLVKHHSIPTAPRRQLDPILRHELARITPFPVDDLFWRWDNATRTGNGARTEVVLTMVPRVAVAAALTALSQAGLKPHFIEIGPAGHPGLIPVGDEARRTTGMLATRLLAFACLGLAIVAAALPFILQTVALYRTDGGIATLQPAITQVDALRRGLAAGDAGRDVLSKEAERNGDVLRTLATVTRIMPDDTYLTDFALRERQMTLAGRSASAPHLITLLSDDPAIRNTAFAAPVTRIEGATTDVFSIKAEIKP